MGKSVEQWVAEHPCWGALTIAEPRLKELGDWVEETPGPFFNGNEPSYADITLASVLGYVKAVGLARVFEAVLGKHSAIKRFMTPSGRPNCE